nr:isoamyl acetate-hydrolyzing esterase 1 like [Quercus suber]
MSSCFRQKAWTVPCHECAMTASVDHVARNTFHLTSPSTGAHNVNVNVLRLLGRPGSSSWVYTVCVLLTDNAITATLQPHMLHPRDEFIVTLSPSVLLARICRSAIGERQLLACAFSPAYSATSCPDSRPTVCIMSSRLYILLFITLLLCGLIALKQEYLHSTQFQLPSKDLFTMDQFLLFGDSITQHSSAGDGGEFNFGGALTNAYMRKLDIVNRGLSGYNSSQALHILPSILPSPHQAHLRFMTVFFGANDARFPNTPGGPEQHVPLAQYKANLRSIVMHPSLKEHSNVRIILITPPPIEERKLRKADLAKLPQLEWTPRRAAATTARYAEAVRLVGQELQVPVLDIWDAMMTRASNGETTARQPPLAPLPGSLEASSNAVLESYLHDGLHFSSKGYKVLYDELMMLIQATWPDQMPDKLDRVLPDWDDTTRWEKAYNPHSQSN